ncbi:MAG: metallophosphoesterase [Anaerorhabdus sp.]|uniref:metallophosphoesterase n=1 Tax=Anaerorhabdus sp. TaxID=1872524 RepID=UPI002FCBC390
MRILFLHISDIHIQLSTDWSEERINKMVDTLNPYSIGKIESVFICLTGDIAFSGFRRQYDTASIMLNYLISKVKERVSEDCHFFMVPGNHDLNYNTKEITNLSKEKNEAIKLSSYKHFANEFFNRNEKINEFEQKLVDINGFTIEINLINTAFYSKIDENDKGIHKLSQSTLNELRIDKKANMVITLMHHAPEWFADECKHELEKIIFSQNTLVFCGHEHNLSAKKIAFENKDDTILFNGGCLSNKGNWNKSEYFSIVFDTNENKIFRTHYRWSLLDNVYEKIETSENRIILKNSAEIPKVTNSFFVDNFTDVSDGYNVSDYFVFPRLERAKRINGKKILEIVERITFLEEIETHKKIILKGEELSGKSTLVREIFREYCIKKYVIFCDVNKIINNNRKQIIRRIFDEQYATTNGEYSKFEQADKNKKMIIIDDIHNVSKKSLDAFLLGMEEDFGYIIYTSSTIIDVDLENTIKNSLSDNSYQEYKILPFYFDKREELIYKVLNNHKDLSNEEIRNLARNIENVLKVQRRFIQLNPGVIVQYINYFMRYQTNTIQGESNAFGSVFQATLINMIQKIEVNHYKIEKIFTILAKIAFFSHKNRKYPISIEDIHRVISNYNCEYASDIDEYGFIDDMIKSKIMKRADESNYFYFANNNILSYFVASEIVSLLDTESVKDCLNYSCYRINETILMFVIARTNNVEILNTIINRALNIADEWPEYSFEDNSIEYLNKLDFDSLNIGVPTDQEREEDKKQELKNDRDMIDNSIVDTVRVYDYDDLEVIELHNQLIRAISLLTTVTRCFPAFEHIMKADQKKDVMNILFSLPNKIFYKWAFSIDSNKKDIIKLILSLDYDDFTRKNRINEEEVLKYLQWQSTSLLLELFNLVGKSAYRENTKTFFTSKDFINLERTIYLLEQLVVIQSNGNFDDFFRKAVNLKQKLKSPLSVIILNRVVHGYMLNNIDLHHSQIQKLEREFFRNISHQSVIVERLKRKNSLSRKR